jgi:hypothetical protein
MPPLSDAALETLRLAVATAEAAGVSAAQAARVRALLAEAPAAAAPPPRPVALAPRADLVRLPASARIGLRFGLLRPASELRAHIDAGGAGQEALLCDGKFALGLTCEDVYNLGYARANVAPSALVLLGSRRLDCWPVGQLAVLFGFSAEQLLAPLGVAAVGEVAGPEALAQLGRLFATRQSAQSFGAAGLTAPLLAGLGCDIAMMQLFRFGVKDLATYMGLTYPVARSMGFTNGCCAAPGWGFSEVRAALALTPEQAEESGLTVRHFLVVPRGAR